ncbi:MAG: glycosyltransferase [Fimbriimonadaceae bacterium]|nr:glycosyltransferase [Fimbriimonadaceae bacterium]
MTCAVYCVHDDVDFLAASLRSVADVPRLVFVSRKDWKGNEGDWKQAAKIAKENGAEVELGDWPDESSHRGHALKAARKKGFTHALTIDSDEILEPGLLAALLKVADNEMADRVYIEWDTYWKDAEHVIRPREPFTPCIMVDLRRAKHVKVREYDGGRLLFLNESHGIVHHLSYAGDDARIWKKTTTWSHRDEIVPGWWELVWKGWDSEPLLRNLHPTHPANYGFAERIPLPDVLKAVGIKPVDREIEEPSVKPCSVVIPAYGEQEALDACLESLVACGELVKEIVVIDDASPKKIKVPKGVKLIRNKENLGFARTCNAGFEATAGDTVLFLNSDTVVPQIALARLLESLWKSGSIMAAGPYSNNVGHFQRIDPTYTDVSRLDLFAEDFSQREEEDRDVDMLVGFCLAVKRSVLEEVGLFDTRYGRGMFEDNDLCYRLRRSGYRLVVSTRSFVHHEGSKSLRSADLDVEKLLSDNHRKYVAKWREDLESGFASSLSGIAAEPIAFHSERKPEARLEKVKKLAKRADISLCMIVKNEERTLADCLNSVKPFVREMLVLDTGSSDRTIEIAKECGAIVREMAWPDSFALARTESMRNAKGKWIMWVDADDTLPLSCGETIVQAVASAPEDVIGFVVPVRFLEDQGNGTEVDHVKVFRNFPGLEWEGRIHEQILASLRNASPDGRLARLNAYVLHSGYDTSETGQAKKRERDEKLLKLDLEERPNHPFVLFNLGMTAHYTDGHEEALDWLRKSIEVSGKDESHLRKAFALLVGSLKALGKMDEAQKECEKGLERVPNDPELLFLLAGLAANRGDHEQAVKLYQESLKGDTGGAFTSMDPGIRGWKALHNVALSHLALGDWDSAKSAWKAAMDGEGRHEAASALFASALEQNDLAAAKETLAWVVAHQGETGMWPGMVGALCDAVGIDPLPQWEEAVLRNPGNDEARRLLALKLLNSGREQEAVAHLNLLQQRGHAQGAVLLAQLAETQGDVGRAEGWYRRATQLGYVHAL